MKQDEWTCKIHSRDKSAYKIFVRKILKVRHHLGGLGMLRERIILNYYLKNWDVRRTGFSWLEI
jgi:hypothetical protein